MNSAPKHEAPGRRPITGFIASTFTFVSSLPRAAPEGGPDHISPRVLRGIEGAPLRSEK